MAILNFGYTWWGQKWLDALMDTDYDNRLPRGKSYARKGAVLKIAIEKNNVTAKVQGSRPSPYNVSLTLKPFNAKEINSILDIVTNNSLYLGALLNRKLPQELYQEFELQKIKIFPQSWSDIKANCSCPDWAECCKHIAAVIYMIANAIDQNPFLVFELHGLDIFAELKKRGFMASGNIKPHINSFSAWLSNEEIATPAFDFSVLKKLDFSLLTNISEQILSILDAKPLFYPHDDFKKILAKIYKNAEKIMELMPDEKSINEETIKITQFSIEVSETLDCKILLKNKKKINELGFDELEKILKNIPQKKIETYSNEIIFLYFLRCFALILLQNSAFIPEIINLQDDSYRIRWLPALLNDKVAEIFKSFVAVAPRILQIKDRQQLKIEEELKILLAGFLHFYLKKDCIPYAGIDLHDKITAMFFTDAILRVKNFAEQEIPNTIALWLSKFYLTHKNYLPVLKIEEKAQDFAASVAVENRAKPLSALIPLADIFVQKQYRDIMMDVFKDLQLLESYFPEIAAILKSKGKERAIIKSDTFPEILFKQLPILKMLGIPFLLPKGLEYLVRPQLSLKVKSKSNNTAVASYLSLDAMLDFDWEIALGDNHISVEEFKQLLKNSRGIVKIKDQFIYFDDKEMEKILKNINKEIAFSAQDKMRMLLTEEYHNAKIKMDNTVKKLLESLRQTEPINIPKTLMANLRPYQQRGYEWLYKNINVGFGSLIADDMGLGKTVQIISLLLKLKEQDKLSKKPALIIVPTSLLSNWQEEIKKFAPTLNAHIYHGAKRELKLTGQDILLTSYGLLRRDVETFAKNKWAAIIIDEAQNIKNPTTAQTKAVKSIKSEIKIAMTGTPVENRLTEYWSILDFLNKGYLHSLETFKKEFAVPIELERDQRCLETFKKATSPFILRRLKTDKTIIKDLPDKIEINQYNNLSKEQTALYQSVVTSVMEQIEEAEGIERKGLVFKLMTNLKQICNHPSHYQKKQEIAPELSGKTEVLLEILKNIYDNNEKVLIFTQYTEMGELLQNLITEQCQTETLLFHGGLSRAKRDALVKAFQNEPQINTMILSLKAGGTGLNLTAATNVIHFDLWWNPAVEAQATDRAYRIGQNKNVMVYRMITKNTFEEKIDNMLKEKKDLANLTVTTGEKWIGELSSKELRGVFGLGE